MKESSMKEASLFWNEAYKNIKEYGFNRLGVRNMDETLYFLICILIKLKPKKRIKLLKLKLNPQKNVEYL